MTLKSRGFSAQIQVPSGHHLPHHGRHAILHAAHGRHQFHHHLRVPVVHRLVARQPGQYRHFPYVILRVVAVGIRCSALHDALNGVCPVAVPVGTQHHKGRPIAPGDGFKLEEFRITLFFSQSLPQVGAPPDVQRIVVPQSPGCVFRFLIHGVFVLRCSRPYLRLPPRQRRRPFPDYRRSLPHWPGRWTASGPCSGDTPPSVS